MPLEEKSQMNQRQRRSSLPTATLVLAAVGAFCLPLPAHADKKEFLALTQQIATLQGQVAEAEKAQADTQKEMRRLMDVLAEQNSLLKRLQQDLRIQDEKVNVGIKDQQERLADIAERLRAGVAQAPPTNPIAGGAGSAPQSQSPPPTSSTAGGSAPAPVIAPRDLYQQSYSDFARKNYELSIQGFLEYLRLYRDTELADNAQYWVGECLQAQAKYEDAVNAFNALLRDFPASDKIPDARYKKGVALEALGRKSQAILEYRFVVERFPGSPAARLAREKLGQP